MKGDAGRILKCTLALVLLWASLHALHFDRFIFHDSWKHIFPVVYRIATSGSCGFLPAWLGTVDNGSAVLAYALSMSLSHPLRGVELYALSCLDIAPRVAAYVHKLQIFSSWLVFAAGMYALGRTLYRQRSSALYVLVATLFSGACLDASHSDQIVSELFWVPWMALAFALFIRHQPADPRLALRYFNLGALVFAVALLDHYPHLVALSAIAAASIHVALWPSTVRFLQRHWRRLWPAAFAIGVVAVQLLFLKSVISDYAPSLRADLVVDPSKFGSTGFVQPTAIVAPFFPLAFLADYDRLFNTLPLYVFKLDVLLFCVGALPLFFALAALTTRTACRRAAVGWALVAMVLVAVSLQQTGLYRVIFHLPFFDLFRGYFLFAVFAVFAFFVLSGYGFDALAAAGAADRRLIARKSIVAMGLLAAGAALLFAWLVHYVPAPGQTVRKLAIPLGFDIAVLLVAMSLALRWSAVVEGDRWALRMLLACAVLQLPLLFGAYRMLAISGDRLFQEYGLETRDRAAASKSDSGTGITRTLCTHFAQCYLSTQHTVSLSLDLEGTFLRRRGEAVFETGLDRRAQEALTGLSRPDVWLSRGMVPFPGESQLVSLFNAAPDLNAILQDRTFAGGPTPMRAQPAAARLGEILAVQRAPDRLAVRYRAPEPQVLNVAINRAPQWHARVSGTATTVQPANFGGMAMQVPAGEGEVVLEYRDPMARLFWMSRWGMVLLAALAAVFLARRSARRPESA